LYQAKFCRREIFVSQFERFFNEELAGGAIFKCNALHDIGMALAVTKTDTVALADAMKHQNMATLSR
jgi:hypothetical protein